MKKEFVSSRELSDDELESMFEKLESGQVIEVDGCFNDDCYIEAIHDELDPSAAKIRTQKRVARVKRAIELSRGRRNRQYRDF